MSRTLSVASCDERPHRLPLVAVRERCWSGSEMLLDLGCLLDPPRSLQPLRFTPRSEQHDAHALPERMRDPMHQRSSFPLRSFPWLSPHVACSL